MALDLDAITKRAKAATLDWSGADLIDIGTFFNETVEEHLAGLDPQTVLALVAHVRDLEADNLLLSTCASAKVVEQLRTAEAECARLRPVVEKLRAGLEPFKLALDRAETLHGPVGLVGVTLEHLGAVGFLMPSAYVNAARLFAETAPDVTADEGRAG